MKNILLFFENKTVFPHQSLKMYLVEATRSCKRIQSDMFAIISFI